jgi:hypothetical protein
LNQAVESGFVNPPVFKRGDDGGISAGEHNSAYKIDENRALGEQDF